MVKNASNVIYKYDIQYMSHLIFAKTIGWYTEKQKDSSKNGMSVTLSYTVIQKPSGSTNINFLTN
jgi:hypothetical protein